jgi:glycerate dehydrogenase
VEHIVFLDRRNIRTELRRPFFEHTWTEYDISRPEELRPRLDGATIAITNRMFLREEHLPPSLRLIALSATGYECIDLDACRARGIAVCNVRGWSVSVPEHVFALALALRRNLPGYIAAVKDGAWSRATSFCALLEPLDQTLYGHTLGIIGHGTLGQSVARIAHGFDMTVLVAEHKGVPEPRPNRLPFDDVLRQSDVLVVLCPLTPATRGLIGARELALMKRTAVLINCARGGIVVEQDLADALVRRQIGGAGVDVLEVEPPPADHPLLRLHGEIDTLIITPHVAWASRDSLDRLGEQLIQNVEAFVRGEPRNLVSAGSVRAPAQ